MEVCFSHQNLIDWQHAPIPQSSSQLLIYHSNDVTSLGKGLLTSKVIILEQIPEVGIHFLGFLELFWYPTAPQHWKGSPKPVIIWGKRSTTKVLDSGWLDSNGTGGTIVLGHNISKWFWSHFWKKNSTLWTPYVQTRSDPFGPIRTHSNPNETIHCCIENAIYIRTFANAYPFEPVPVREAFNKRSISVHKPFATRSAMQQNIAFLANSQQHFFGNFGSYLEGLGSRHGARIQGHDGLNRPSGAVARCP